MSEKMGNNLEQYRCVRENGCQRVLVIYTGGTIGMKKDPELGMVVLSFLLKLQPLEVTTVTCGPSSQR